MNILAARSRFVAAILGALVASIVWLVWTVATSATPEDARARRATPRLPPPSVEVERRELKQVAWYPCAPDMTVVTAQAPRVPASQRLVVTGIARRGMTVRTGTKLGVVGGVPIGAIATRAVFYRDLVAGDSGPDVRALNESLARAGFISQTGPALSASTIRIWNSHLGAVGVGDTIAYDTLVAVPERSRVVTVLSGLGEQVRTGAPLVEVSSSSDALVCEVPDAAAATRSADVVLEVDGKQTRAASVIVRPRTRRSPGSILVKPSRPVADTARLGVVSAASDGEVLAVPLSAVRVSASGQTVVQVLHGDVAARDGRDVEVALGVTAQGWVEVSGTSLTEGTVVELFDRAESSSGSTIPLS